MSRMHLWLAVLLVTIANVADGQAPPPPDDAAGSLAAGVAALRAGNLDEADALLAAIASSASPQAGTAQFYLGLSAQTRADQATSREARRTALERARQAYEAAATLLPTSGATLNNLARVLAGLGESAAASAALDRAIALQDGKESAYLRTRADIAVQTKASSGATIRALSSALLAAPADQGLQTQFVAEALATDPKALAAAADTLNTRGDVEAAEALIVRALPDPRAPRLALMLELADSRAGQRYLPQSFATTAAAAALRQIASDVSLGACVREFLALHENPSGKRTAYPWWAIEASDFEPPHPRSRTARFRNLALRLAETYRVQETEDALRAAQPYAELALDLSGPDLDPKAVSELAAIYAQTDQMDRLRAMSESRVRILFEGKGGAYAQNDLPKIYEYHLALGTIFGYLGQWGSSNQPTSAIFQLEHARSTAARINERSGNPRAVVVPPTTVALLADAYTAVDRPDDSIRVRLEAASVYRAQDRPVLESAVLDVPADKVRPALERSSESTRLKWSEYRPLPPGLGPAPMSTTIVQPDHSPAPAAPANLAIDASPVGNAAQHATTIQSPSQIAVAQQAAPSMGPLRANTNLQGSDLPGTGTSSPSAEACSEACRTNSDCRAMTFVASAPQGGVCWLKSSVPAPQYAYGMTSAEKRP